MSDSSSSGRPPERTRRQIDVSDQAWGSDFIADFLAAYGFEFVAFTPGSSFRGVEESIINYNDNVPPVIETAHEGISVSIAQGYAKATGEPAVCLLHDVVGTLHGTMNLFNAYCDRVPLVALAGAGPVRRSDRRPFYDWIHTALDQGTLVRAFTKWADQPADSDDVAESLLRALKITTMPPRGPVYVALDQAVQENRLDEPLELPDFEQFAPPTAPAPDPEATARAADTLVDAELPVVLVDMVGDSRSAVRALVELAETLGAAVVHSHRLGTPHRYNFPNTHPLDLAGTDILRRADVVLALDVLSPNFRLTDTDTATRRNTDVIEGEFDFIDVGLRDVRAAGVAGDEFEMRETDLSIRADTELAVPALLDAVRERLDADGTDARRVRERRETLSDLHDDQRAEWRRQAEEAWDETPISLPRLASDLWDVVSDEDWVLVNGTLRGWTYKLWEIDDFDEYIGGYSGGGGIGHGVGHAIGGALAYDETDRVPINLQPDGDLMFYPGGLWTITHLDLPVFTVVHNNRSMYSSTHHRMRLAEHRGRDASYERALVGTGIHEPVPDYATLAESMDMIGYGPVEDPDDLAPTLREAWADVTSGEPVLVDVICQPR